MTSENNKTESYIKFDGKDERKFQEWTTASSAVGIKEGWLEILISNVTLDRASEKGEDIVAVLKNDLAYNYMVKTCTDDALEYVWAARTATRHGRTFGMSTAASRTTLLHCAKNTTTAR